MVGVVGPLIVILIYLLAACYHRKEVKKGNEGISVVGPILFDPFWKLIEALPNGENLIGWFDAKYGEIEQEGQRVAKRIQNADQKRSQQKSIQQILSISKEINNTAESNQDKSGLKSPPVQTAIGKTPPSSARSEPVGSKKPTPKKKHKHHRHKHSKDSPKHKKHSKKHHSKDEAA